MKIVLLTMGTRGDVQPFVALGQGLKRAGYEVKLVTGTDFEDDVRSQGLEFAPLRADIHALLASPEGKAVLAGDKLSTLRLVRDKIIPMTRDILEDCWAAVADADAIVYHPKILAGPHLAEKLGIPAFRGFFLPLIVPTHAFPLPILTRRSLGGFVNRLSYRLMDSSVYFLRKPIRQWRQASLGLKPKQAKGFEASLPVLYAFSRHVIPPPSDWGDHVHVTGFWHPEPPTDWRPPTELSAFLSAGEAPVYVGFGSMTSRKPEETATIVFDALRMAGCRAIVSEGWGGMKAGNVPENVLMIRDVPHEWLFRQVSAVVHHGGAGTTSAGLRAGKPTVICPFMGDQPYWGDVVHRMGLGPKPIPQKRLTANLLASAISESVGDESKRVKAVELGEKLRSENGVMRAVEIVSERLGRSRS